MSKLRIPPNKESSTYGVQERALPLPGESGQGWAMRDAFKETGKRLWRLAPAGVGMLVSLKFGEVVATARTNWTLALNEPPPGWLTEKSLSPWVQPALAVIILASMAWALWPALAGMVGWIAALLKTRRSAAPADGAPVEPGAGDYIPLDEAGRWLYANASEGLREWLKSMVPDPFETIAEHATAYYRTQWQEGRCDLYGRWEAGLPMEKIDPKDGDFAVFSAGFGSDKRPILDQSVLRRDLHAVLAFYEDAVGSRRNSRAGAEPQDKPATVLIEHVLSVTSAAVYPASGRALSLVVFNLDGGLGLGTRMGAPGSPVLGKGHKLIDLCQVTNYGDATFLDLELGVTLTTHEVIERENGSKESGPEVASVRRPLRVPKVAPGDGVAELIYIENATGLWLGIEVEAEATATRAADGERVRIKVIAKGWERTLFRPNHWP